MNYTNIFCAYAGNINKSGTNIQYRIFYRYERVFAVFDNAGRPGFGGFGFKIAARACSRQDSGVFGAFV